ncbi:hypothetical protein [Tenuibacillus multivorans]|uniref:hypothetical protein n=1 Tax=Tenuibacillus multivorans TaxID=237069 RepID=UPI000B865746|nr:hypothetical protein [Tenuibacillus multivorans]
MSLLIKLMLNSLSDYYFIQFFKKKQYEDKAKMGLRQNFIKNIKSELDSIIHELVQMLFTTSKSFACRGHGSSLLGRKALPAGSRDSCCHREELDVQVSALATNATCVTSLRKFASSNRRRRTWPFLVDEASSHFDFVHFQLYEMIWFAFISL